MEQWLINMNSFTKTAHSACNKNNKFLIVSDKAFFIK